MLIRLLGITDLISGFISILAGAGVYAGKEIILIFGIILILKSFIGMLKDIASWIDIMAGILLILSAFFNIPGFLLIITGLLIMQKGIFSFL